jgi:Polysulphide reductase, NrfD
VSEGREPQTNETAHEYGSADSPQSRTRTAAGRGRRGGGERRMVPTLEPRSYYGRPVLKEPVWKPEIPLYFWTGGLAGASAALAFGAELGGEELLARRAWLAALAGISASPALLIADLGVPRRFLNMLRVFKVTSPMSVGSWLLASAGPAIAVATASNLSGRFRPAGRVAGASAALLGPPLSTYTGALVADTAVPVWHEARRELPFVFAASAAATAGAAVTVATPPKHAGAARALAIGGGLAEVALAQLMEHRLGELGEPYHQGRAGRYGRLAKGALAGGALALGARGATTAGAALVMAGSLLERWAIFRAGFQSAADPKYTVGPQRERTAHLAH